MKSRPNFYYFVICLWILLRSFRGGSNGKESACNAGDKGSIPGMGSTPAGGNGNPLQYSCLENPTDRGAWWAAKSWTRLKRLGVAWILLGLQAQASCAYLLLVVCVLCLAADTWMHFTDVPVSSSWLFSIVTEAAGGAPRLQRSTLRRHPRCLHKSPSRWACDASGCRVGKERMAAEICSWVCWFWHWCSLLLCFESGLPWWLRR